MSSLHRLTGLGPRCSRTFFARAHEIPREHVVQLAATAPCRRSSPLIFAAAQTKRSSTAAPRYPRNPDLPSSFSTLLLRHRPASACNAATRHTSALSRTPHHDAPCQPRHVRNTCSAALHQPLTSFFSVPHQEPWRRNDLNVSLPQRANTSLDRTPR